MRFSYIFLSLACGIFANKSLCADSITLYDSTCEKSTEQAAEYKKFQDNSLKYLAYRDIPELIIKYVRGNTALDYGVGTGFSASLLQRIGFDVVAVDISSAMIAEAKQTIPQVQIELVNKGHLPFEDAKFVLIFSGLVLFEIGSKDEIIDYLREGLRTLQTDGVFIALTGSEHVFSAEWENLKVDYPQNHNLQSGDLARSYVIDPGIEFIDYYWTENDYIELFNLAGMEILEIHHPLGKEDEPYLWKDEKKISPYVIFVAKRRS